MNRVDPAPKQVGFVGVGQMGRPMVDQMVAAGFPVAAFVRRRDVAESLESVGVTLVGTTKELARRSDVLIICTFSDDQLATVVFGDDHGDGALAAMRPGSVLVNHVTGNPALVSDIAARAPAGVEVVDAPVSGTARDIAAGKLTVLVGASGAVVDMVRPVLASYADPILHVGAVGDAQRVKLVNNLLFTVHVRVAIEAVALGDRMGIDRAVLASALGCCSASSRALSLLEQMSAADVVAGAGHYLAKDVKAVKATAAALGVDLGELGDLARWVLPPSEGAQ